MDKELLINLFLEHSLKSSPDHEYSSVFPIGLLHSM